MNHGSPVWSQCGPCKNTDDYALRNDGDMEGTYECTNGKMAQWNGCQRHTRPTVSLWLKSFARVPREPDHEVNVLDIQQVMQQQPDWTRNSGKVEGAGTFPKPKAGKCTQPEDGKTRGVRLPRHERWGPLLHEARLPGMMVVLLSYTLGLSDRLVLDAKYSRAWRTLPQRSVLVASGYRCKFEILIYNMYIIIMTQNPPFWLWRHCGR